MLKLSAKVCRPDIELNFDGVLKLIFGFYNFIFFLLKVLLTRHFFSKIF